MDIHAYTNKGIAKLMHDKGIRMSAYDYVYTSNCDVYPYPVTMEHTLRMDDKIKVFPCYHLWDVLQWFRDYRDMHVVILPYVTVNGISSYKYDIICHDIRNNEYVVRYKDYCPSYEEAVESAILWILNNLVRNEKKER